MPYHPEEKGSTEPRSSTLVLTVFTLSVLALLAYHIFSVPLPTILLTVVGTLLLTGPNVFSPPQQDELEDYKRLNK